MIARLYLGTTPYEENCVQLGVSDYLEYATLECEQYIGYLKELFPQWEEKGLTFNIQEQPHDFGIYLETVLTWDSEDEQATEYACYIEEDLPALWPNEGPFSIASRLTGV